MSGKVSRATELRTKTVPSETAISSSLGVGDGRDGGDGAAAADGGAGADEKGLFLADMQELAEQHSQREGEGDADGGVKEAGAADVDDLAEIHAEAETDDGGLQQKLREAVALCLEVVDGGESEDDASRQSQRR